MQRMLRALPLLALGLGLPATAIAQVGEPPAAGQADRQIHEGRGTVNRVDVKSGKVNLTHQPIPSLGWPGMTMDFVVSDRETLARLKPGQQVQFQLKQLGNQYVISDIRPEKQ